MTDRRRTRLVVVASIWYAGLVVLLAWQAERGQSILAPDAVTLATLLGWIAAAAIASNVAVRSAGPVTA